MDLRISSTWTWFIMLCLQPLLPAFPSVGCSFRSLISDLSVCVCLSGCLQWKPGLSRNCICYSWPATIGGGDRVCSLYDSLRAILDCSIQWSLINNTHLCSDTGSKESNHEHTKEKKSHFLSSRYHATHMLRNNWRKGHNGNWNNAVMRIATTLQGDTSGQLKPPIDLHSLTILPLQYRDRQKGGAVC